MHIISCFALLRYEVLENGSVVMRLTFRCPSKLSGSLIIPHVYMFYYCCAGADPERVKREVEEVVGLDCSNAILASAKQGIGIDEILEEVVRRIPPPPDNRHKPLRALIFDSYYDAYKVQQAIHLRMQMCCLTVLSWMFGPCA